MAKRILVIDDERDMQVYLRTLLRKAGYEVDVARDGEEGLSKVKSFKPDLITLDLVMPKRSGMTAYDSLRRAPETEEIPIVIVTGLGAQARLLSPKPQAVVDKPIDREDFLATLGALIGEP